MKRKRLLSVRFLSVALLTATSGNAHAVFGVGDISYDPTVHAELVSMYNQARQMYDTAIEQLNRLERMQHTIEEANRAYDRLTNIDIKKVGESLRPGEYGKQHGADRLRAMRAGLQRIGNEATNQTEYVERQLSRIADLEKLVSAQEAAAKNAETAATDLDVRRSGQITAQSASTLTALAAVEEQRRQQEEIARGQEAQRQRDLLSDSAKLYGAMGGPSPNRGNNR